MTEAPEGPIEVTRTMLFTDEAHVLWSRRCRVEIASGPATGEWCLLEEQPIRLGSAPDNALCIPDDRSVSREHLQLELKEDGVLVHDLGSTNGTFFQNVRIREVTLQPDFELRVGKTYLRVRADNERVALPAADTQFEVAVGQSAPMRQIFQVLSQVAPAKTTVLLEGETGTGKEVLAESIHLRSPRRNGPFVIFDAGAVPSELIESELMGHVKGAYTGATANRRGAFEQAHQGTLFIDEIGELALELQPKLLRVIESQKVRRVGGDTTTQVDVRVVAATNRDLKEEVQAGRFRADLYYRIAVVCIDVPPLRERSEDILLLLDHFVGKGGDRPPQEVIALLQKYSWPGNVRELRNVIERSRAIGWAEALIDMGIRQAVETGKLATGPGEINLQIPFKVGKAQVVESFERAYFEALIKKTGGNVSEAARVAGIDRNHVAKLLQKYGLAPSRPSADGEGSDDGSHGQGS